MGLVNALIPKVIELAIDIMWLSDGINTDQHLRLSTSPYSIVVTDNTSSTKALNSGAISRPLIMVDTIVLSRRAYQTIRHQHPNSQHLTCIRNVSTPLEARWNHERPRTLAATGDTNTVGHIALNGVRAFF